MLKFISALEHKLFTKIYTIHDVLTIRPHIQPLRNLINAVNYKKIFDILFLSESYFPFPHGPIFTGQDYSKTA